MPWAWTDGIRQASTESSLPTLYYVDSSHQTEDEQAIRLDSLKIEEIASPSYLDNDVG